MTTVETVRLYPIPMVAEILGMSRVWVYDQIKRGRLGVVDLGDKRSKQRVRADTLQAFVDARTFPAMPKEGQP